MFIFSLIFSVALLLSVLLASVLNCVGSQFDVDRKISLKIYQIIIEKMEYTNKQSLSFHVIFIMIIPVVYAIYRCLKYCCRNDSFSKVSDSTGKFDVYGRILELFVDFLVL